ncbi:MAG: hypothetical protein ACKPE1_17680, partial [Dolichospermum sp.]
KTLVVRASCPLKAYLMKMKSAVIIKLLWCGHLACTRCTSLNVSFIPHPQPPPRKRGGDYDVFDIIKKREVQILIIKLLWCGHLAR